MRFSALRGERIALPGGIVLINDCYNANPMSMRAAIEDLTETASGPASAPVPARRLAVLGDMLELGAEAGPALHREVGAYASARGVDVLVTVGPQAAAMARGVRRRGALGARRRGGRRTARRGCCARATRCS